MKDGELRVMVIGAHPDDPDLNAGCTVMKLIEAGAMTKRLLQNVRHGTMFLPVKRFWQSTGLHRAKGMMPVALVCRN